MKQLTKGERDGLIAYSRKPDNLPSAFAIGEILADLRLAIFKEFQDALHDYLRKGPESSWSIVLGDPVPKKAASILSLKPEGLDGEIRRFVQPWRPEVNNRPVGKGG